MADRHWTRRKTLQRAGAVIAGGAGLGASRGNARARTHPGDAAVTADTAQYWNFISRPDLRPPVVTITRDGSHRDSNSGYVFIAPQRYPQLPGSAGEPQSGLLIMDWDGEVVWFSGIDPANPLTGIHADSLTAQAYRGKPVLTWWEGRGSLIGTLFTVAGTYTIADSSYTPVATVAAVGDGYAADNHDCVLTPHGTAYITVGRMTSADLTPIGGSVNGQVWDSTVQEIDIATGDLLFQWDALKNIPVDETHLTYSPAGPIDPYHFNSVAVAPDGDLFISARNTWTVYKVSRRTGAIAWRLGGKRSDFSMGPGAGFAWQHDVRPQGHRILSIFDNEAVPPEAPQSRAILIDMDTLSMRASLIKQYTRPGGVLAGYEGSMRILGGGRVLVGWGIQPYFSEFSADGQVLLDAQFPVVGGPQDVVYQSYRVVNFDWRGMPVGIPAAAARPGAAGGAVVAVSWNGVTEVARWTVLAGRTPSELAPAGSAKRAGFETSIPVSDAGPYFVAVAEDAHGRELGRSNPVTPVATG